MHDFHGDDDDAETQPRPEDPSSFPSSDPPATDKWLAPEGVDGAVKIVIVADTHLPQRDRRAGVAFERIARERPDAIFHCGDVTKLSSLAPLIEIARLHVVAGNNDGDEIVASCGRSKVVCEGNLRIGMVHGDGVRGTTLDRALAAFAPDAVDVITFGHSHVPCLNQHGGIWVMNPGSPTDKRRQLYYSYGVIDVESSGNVRPRLVYFS
jgi:putative phosphoesterase